MPDRFNNGFLGENAFKIMIGKKHDINEKNVSRLKCWDDWTGIYKNSSIDAIINEFNKHFDKSRFNGYYFSIFKQTESNKTRNGRKRFKWQFVRMI